MQLHAEATPLRDVYIIKPDVFQDDRGFFTELYRKDQFAQLGLPDDFVQWNHSGNVRGVTRGLHFQWEPPMGKLMRVVAGEAFLVAVDIRKGSSTLGRHVAVTASAANRLGVYAPAGFARGFCVTSERAEIMYLCTNCYDGRNESGVLWNDPELAIPWPVADPILSEKDKGAQTLADWLRRPQSDFFRY